METLGDAAFLLVGFAAITKQMQQQEGLDQVFLPWFAVMSWLRCLYSFRGEKWVGLHMLPIISAVRDTGAFFFVTGMCLAAATHAYFILGPRGEDPLPVYSAFLHTARLGLFGDFDIFEFQGQDPTYQRNGLTGEWEPQDPSPEELGQRQYVYVHLSFFMVGIGITILLMNLLIGILGQNYEVHHERAQVLFVQARARMLLEHGCRPWAWLTCAYRPQQYQESTESLSTEAPRALHCLFFSILPLMLAFGIDPTFPSHVLRLLGSSRHQSVGRWRSRCFQAAVLLCCPFLFGLSLAGAVLFAIFAFALLPFGVRVQGLQHTMRTALFGDFGDGIWASRCHIYCLVRKQPNADNVRGMRSDLKERMSTMEQSVKERMSTMEQNMKDSINELHRKIEKLMVEAGRSTSPAAGECLESH